MWDEIPMMWFIMSWGYILVHLQTPGTGNPRIIFIGLAYAIFCSVVHYYGSYVVAFQLYFTAMVFWTIIQLTGYALNEKKSHFSFFPVISVISISIALIFWVTDQVFCETLLESGFYPQGHALWHVLNSFCIHYGVHYTLALRLQHLGFQVTEEYHFYLPFIVPKTRDKHINSD